MPLCNGADIGCVSHIDNMAATSSRLMVLCGWHCSVRTCARSVLSWQLTIPSSKSWPSNLRTTGKPVSDFLVKWRVDVPGGAWQGASGFSQWTTRTSIPAAKDVSLEVSANGHRTWVYIDPSNQSRPSYLRLESGERKSISIELQPEAKNTSTTQ
jgi:hypothetical protein